MIATRSPGNTPLDPDELDGLIPDLSLKRELDEFERNNILDGYNWALSPRRLRFRDPLREPYVRELHRRMFDQTWEWAGRYRNTEKKIGALVHEIRSSIPVLLGDAQYWHANKTYAIDEVAVRVHNRLVWIHPFPNGNGSHARLLADVVAVKYGSTPLTWGRIDIAAIGPAREAYLAALRIADNNEFQDLLAFARASMVHSRVSPASWYLRFPFKKPAGRIFALGPTVP
jgi:Fic-DOC domain mobile mystery protein B